MSDTQLPAPSAPAPNRVRAAQYVRMSTEHQQYSTQNQEDVIRDYAAKRGFEIVRTYADEGKSGLRIEGREALKKLISDVQDGTADFRAILVYDISRWGRFQDSDESAYYEYVCKRAGIQVSYCAEQFENDGSPTATIIKSVKRAMAGEYSRELSSKVFKGQCRLIQLGYRQGGPAGYGLRRMLIDQSGEPKGQLKVGEHKSLQTDRVILVPGPKDEIETVRRVYRLFTKEGKREAEIAKRLIADGISSESGRLWTRGMVHQILTNEKYIGHNVYNRISNKLKKQRVKNPPEMWVRANDAFEGIVDPEAFYVARGIIQERNRVFSDEEMIARLKQLLSAHTKLSASLIDDADGMPGSGAYRTRFGSLIGAYGRAGYHPDRDYDFLEVNRRLRALHPDLVSQTVQELQGIGASVTTDEDTNQLLINEEFRAAMVVTRCRRTPGGDFRWQITLDQQTPPDVTIVARLDPENERPCDYYLLPRIDVRLPSLRLSRDNGIYWDAYRFPTLQYFVQVSARVRIEVAA